MSIRALIFLLILPACAGPTAHQKPAPGSAQAPSQQESARPPAGSILGPADPLAEPGAPPGEHHHHQPAESVDVKVIDPTCKMSIDPKTAAGGTLTVEGKQHWFCSTSCRRAFEAKNPGAK